MPLHLPPTCVHQQGIPIQCTGILDRIHSLQSSSRRRLCNCTVHTRTYTKKQKQNKKQCSFSNLTNNIIWLIDGQTVYKMDVNQYDQNPNEFPFSTETTISYSLACQANSLTSIGHTAYISSSGYLYFLDIGTLDITHTTSMYTHYNAQID